MASIENSEKTAAKPTPEDSKALITELMPKNEPNQASQLADSIIKNQGFGKNEERSDNDILLGHKLLDGLKNNDDSTSKFVAEVNKELALKGSTLKLDESGGGGGAGKQLDKNSYEKTAEVNSKFSIVDEGKAKDSMSMSASTDKVVKNGKVVGEHEEIRGETGGSGGGRGELSSFKLHEMLIEEAKILNNDSSGKPGGGGGGGGGSKGGRSPMEQKD